MSTNKMELGQRGIAFPSFGGSKLAFSVIRLVANVHLWEKTKTKTFSLQAVKKKKEIKDQIWVTGHGLLAPDLNHPWVHHRFLTNTCFLLPEVS